MSTIHGWSKGKIAGMHFGSELVSLTQEHMDLSVYDYFTYWESFSFTPKRVRGEYHFKNVVAILDSEHTSKNMCYELKIQFTCLKDCKELYDLIRAGRIWPDICYEEEQVPAPCRHLKELFREAIGIIRREFARKLHFA